jgi:hypothetical protein
LHEGAVRTGDVGPVERSGDGGSRLRRPDHGQRTALDHEVSGAVEDADDGVGRLGDADDPPEADELEIATRGSRNLGPVAIE